MNIDQFGRVEITEKEAIDSVYSGHMNLLDAVYISEGVDRYNRARKQNADTIPKLKKLDLSLSISIDEFDKQNQAEWFMPKDYANNLIENLYSLCTTEQQIKRVDQELELFIQNNLIDVLYYLKYLVDKMREHHIVWGVGRGSCVASYVLYLMGVHKIDPIKYQIDITEFLK